MLKTLAAQVKEFKAASFATPIFMVGEVVMELLIPYLMATIIDDGIQAGNFGHVVRVGLLMLLCAALGLLFGILGGKYGAKASCGFARNLREAMFNHIQSYSFREIDKYSTAGLVTRLTTDVTNLQNAYQMILRMAVRSPIMLVVAFLMALNISPRLSLVFLAAMLFLILGLGLVMSRAMNLFPKVFRKYDDLNASVQENVTSIRTVKSFVREDYENKKFTKEARHIYDLFCKAEGILALNNPFMMIAVYGCILLLSWFGAHFIVAGTLTTGNLTSLFSYVMSIMMSLMMLSMVFVMITMSAASAKRVAEVLNERSTLEDPAQPVSEVADGSIRFDNVTFGYNTTGEPVLKNVNLEIRSGETIGIIGGTGSAKSTLVSLISRLYDVTDGSVQVGGRDVREYDIESLRNQVSVVLQKNVLFSGSILENLRWGDENATDEECVRACRLACADEFIEKMPDGYHTHIEQGGNNVSGGQKQRLCIARALLKKPKVLILDDSTSAVDTATDARIREAFATEIPNTTKLIIAQRISSVQNADRIIVLDDGRIDGFDTHENLLRTNEVYRDVYESQTSGGGDFDEGGAA